MKNNFNICLQKVLKDEGGYTNDPNDNGGPTNFGITQRETSKPVKTLTVNDATAIYKAKYWDSMGCDSLPAGVDYTCFDYAVNSGIGRSRKALERFKSLRGTELIDAINNERTTFLRNIGVGHNAGFLKGWLSRVNRVRTFSHYLAESKDNTSGASTGVILGGGLWIALSNYLHAHQIYIIIGSVAVASVVGIIIHKLINRKN